MIIDKELKKRSNNNYQKQEPNNLLCGLENKIEKLMYVISTIAITPCVILLIFWVFLMTVYVIGRKFFNLQWVFVEEFTGYMMVFIAYFTQAYVLKVGGYIRLGIVFSKLTKKMQFILESITGFLAFFFTCYLIWKSLQWFNYAFEKKIASSTLHLVLWPSYLTVTIGLSLLALELALNFCLKVIKFIKST